MKQKAMRRQTAIAIQLLVMLTIPYLAMSQSGFELGGQAGAAPRMGFSARGISSANALSADPSGEGLAYYNPALTPFLSRPMGLISAGFLSFDRHLNHVSYAQRLKPAGGFSIALINAGVSGLQGRDLDARVTDVYSTSENQLLFSFGMKLREDFSVGVSAKILYFSLFRDVKSTTVGFDIGALYVPSDAWAFAVVVGDLNAKYKWDTSQLYGRDGTTTIDRFPLSRKFAASYKPEFLPGRVAAEIEWIGAIIISRIGAHIKIHENIAVSAGLDQVDFSRRIDPKPTFGLSLTTSWNTWNPTLHYAYVLEPYSTGGFHVVSLSMAIE